MPAAPSGGSASISAGREQAALQRRGVEERLQRAAGRALRAGEVDGAAGVAAVDGRSRPRRAPRRCRAAARSRRPAAPRPRARPPAARAAARRDRVWIARSSVARDAVVGGETARRVFRRADRCRRRTACSASGGRRGAGPGCSAASWPMRGRYSAGVITAWSRSASRMRPARGVGASQAGRTQRVQARGACGMAESRAISAQLRSAAGLVEIPARGMADAVAALAVGRQAQILRQHGRPAVAGGERQRGAGLDRLGPQRARRAGAACARPAWRWWRRRSAPLAGAGAARRRAARRRGSTPGCDQKRRSSSASVARDHARPAAGRRASSRIRSGVPPPGRVTASPTGSRKAPLRSVDDRRRRRRGQRARRAADHARVDQHAGPRGQRGREPGGGGRPAASTRDRRPARRPVLARSMPWRVQHLGGRRRLGEAAGDRRRACGCADW